MVLTIIKNKRGRFDGLETKDKRNANIAASCIAFLTSQPNSGLTTMQTVNLFVNNRSVCARFYKVLR